MDNMVSQFVLIIVLMLLEVVLILLGSSVAFCAMSFSGSCHSTVHSHALLFYSLQKSVLDSFNLFGRTCSLIADCNYA